jgi:hypothetical protein
MCVWIGTVWQKGSELLPHLLIPRKSIGIGGEPATLESYERVGILTIDKYSKREAEVDIIMN